MAQLRVAAARMYGKRTKHRCHGRAFAGLDLAPAAFAVFPGEIFQAPARLGRRAGGQPWGRVL